MSRKYGLDYLEPATKAVEMGRRARARTITADPAAYRAGTPEVVVKVVSWQKSRRAVASLARYVTRTREGPANDNDGADEPIEATTDDGRVLKGRAAIDAELGAWQLRMASENRSRAWRQATRAARAEMTEADALAYRQSVHVMVSLPASLGAHEAELRQAVAESLSENFGAAGYRYIWAIHTDGGRPHAHVVIRARSTPGAIPGDRPQQLRLHREHIQGLRTDVASRLRERGVNIQATRRIDRPDLAPAIHAGREPPRRNDTLAQRVANDRHDAVEKQAPRWYATHGLDYERRLVGRGDHPPGKLFRRREATAEWPATSAVGHAAVEGLREHLAATYVNPARAEQRLADLVTESRPLAEWAVAKHPELIGSMKEGRRGKYRLSPDLPAPAAPAAGPSHTQTPSSRHGRRIGRLAPTWYAAHGLAYERRRVEPKQHADRPPGLLDRARLPVRWAPQGERQQAAVARLREHLAATYVNPARAEQRFADLYAEAPKLAVWAANEHLQAFGTVRPDAQPTRVTGRYLPRRRSPDREAAVDERTEQAREEAASQADDVVRSRARAWLSALTRRDVAATRRDLDQHSTPDAAIASAIETMAAHAQQVGPPDPSGRTTPASVPPGGPRWFRARAEFRAEAAVNTAPPSADERPRPKTPPVTPAPDISVPTWSQALQGGAQPSPGAADMGRPAPAPNWAKRADRDRDRGPDR